MSILRDMIKDAENGKQTSSNMYMLAREAVKASRNTQENSPVGSAVQNSTSTQNGEKISQNNHVSYNERKKQRTARINAINSEITNIENTHKKYAEESRTRILSYTKSGNGAAAQKENESVKAAYTVAQNKINKLKAERKTLEDEDKWDKAYDDDFLGQWSANYHQSRLNNQISETALNYMRRPTEENKIRLAALNEMMTRFAETNKDTLNREDATLPWLSFDLASQIPQSLNTWEETIKVAPQYVMTGMGTGAAAGAVAGAPVLGVGAAAGATAGGLTGLGLGLKTAYVAGSAQAGYEQMTGAAFNELLNMGLSIEDATKLASQEGFVNSLIESGEALLDVVTWGASGKLAGGIKDFVKKSGKNVLLKMGVSEAGIKKILSNKAVKVASVGAKVLMDAAGEGTEEGSQQAVSITNRHRAEDILKGKAIQGNSFTLAKDTVAKAFTGGFTDDEEAEIKENASAGFRTGLMFAGIHGGANYAVNRITDSNRYKAIKETNAVTGAMNQMVDKKHALEPLSKNASVEEIQQRREELTDRMNNPLDYMPDVQPTATVNKTVPVKSEKTKNAEVNSSFGENGKKAYAANYRSGQSAEGYHRGFTHMYNLGQSNVDLEKFKNEINDKPYVRSLSSDQRMATYYAGQTDAKLKLEAEKNDVKLVNIFSKDAGVVENDVVSKVKEEDLRAIDRLAKVLGAQVVFENDIEGRNGFIDNGQIHISVNAQNKMAVVMAHEAVHRMQELAPESYRAYRDYVMSAVGMDAIDDYRDFFHSKDVYMSESDIMDEIAADYTKDMLTDADSMHKFIDDALNGRINKNASLAENRNILQRLYDAISEFLKKVKEKFNGRKADQTRAARDVFGVDIDELGHAKNLLKQALRDSADVVEQLKSEGIQTDVVKTGKVRYSTKMSFSNQVDAALDKTIERGYSVYVGKTPNLIVKCGFDPELPMLMNPSHMRDVNHSKDPKNIHYHGLNRDIIKQIPEQIKHPVMIYDSISEQNENAVCIVTNLKDDDGLPVIISLRANSEQKNKYYDVNVEKFEVDKSNFVTSAYGKDGFFSHIEDVLNKDALLYANKEKTLKLFSDRGLQLPTQWNNLGYDKIIHQSRNIVNTYSMQKSENNSDNSVKNTQENVTKQGKNLRNSYKMDEDILRQNRTLKKVNLMLHDQLFKLQNEKSGYKKEKIATVTKKMLKEFDFAYDPKLLTERMSGLAEDTKQMMEGKISEETLRNKIREVARDVIDAGTRSDSAAYQESKAMRDHLRTMRVSVSEETRRNLGDEYESIRKRTFGRLGLVKEGGVPLDIAYQELSELYPMYFSSETETNQSEQLRQIESVLDSLQSLKSNPYDGYMDEATEWLSGMMMDQIYNEIFISGETGKVNVSLDMKAMRSEMADNLQRVMQRDREWREREYTKLQDRYEKKVKKYSEARQKTIKTQQIKLHVSRLSKALVNPSDTFAVPEDLKQPVAELLSCIDVTSDSMGERTRETLGDLMRTYRRIADQEYELGMVLDPQLLYNLEDISDSIKELGVENKKLRDLPLDTLEKMRTSIMAMETMLRNYNRTLREGKAEQIDVLGSAVCDEVKARIKGIKKESKFEMVRNTSELLNYDMASPEDFFRMLGSTMKGLYDGIREGMNSQIRNLNHSVEYLTELRNKYGVIEKEVSGKKAKVYEFTLSNGSKIELTKAQIMSFYCLLRQPGAHEHMLEGGIRPATLERSLVEEKDGEKKVVTSVSKDFEAQRVSLEDIAEITGALSDNEKRFAEGISKFFTDECAAWGNDVSLKLYGYKKFNIQNYFPIVSDKMYLQEDYAVSADATLKNMGVTKKRIKHANNPIIIEDIFDVYTRHVSDMANYNAFVLPLQDIQRVFNSRGFDGKNNVKALIASKFGEAAPRYFAKFMADINMGPKSDVGTAFAKELIAKYKAAKIGANLRVVVQQPISYIRAAAVLETKYLARASGHGVKLETVYQYSPIARWKDWGFFSMDTGRNMRDLISGKKRVSDYTMALAGAADRMTWKKIWNACELEVADKHPELQKGSDEFYRACGKRFDEVIDRTQVVDSTLHRAQIMRSADTWTKISVSFMTEPLKTYNLLRSAVLDYKATGSEEAKKALGRIVATCAVSSVALAVVTAAYDALTGDEDDEGFYEGLYNKMMGNEAPENESQTDNLKRRFLANFVDNLIGDYAGMIPYAKDVYSAIQGFTPKRMDLQGVGDFISSIKKFGNKNYTIGYRLANITAKAADACGIPVSSFKKSVYDLVLKNVFKGVNNQWFDYNLTKQMYRVDLGNNDGKFIDVLFDAWRNGHKEQYDAILKDMLKNNMDAGKIESELRKRFKKLAPEEKQNGFSVPWDNATEIKSEEKEKKYSISNLSPTQYEKYQRTELELEREVVDSVKGMKMSADVYNAALSAAYTYAEETALEKASGGDFDSEAAWINLVQAAADKINPAQIIKYKAEYDLKTQTIEKILELHDEGIDIDTYLKERDYMNTRFKTAPGGGKWGSGKKKAAVINYLNSLDVSPDEWNALYEAAGYKK